MFTRCFLVVLLSCSSSCLLPAETETPGQGPEQQNDACAASPLTPGSVGEQVFSWLANNGFLGPDSVPRELALSVCAPMTGPVSSSPTVAQETESSPGPCRELNFFDGSPRAVRQVKSVAVQTDLPVERLHLLRGSGGRANDPVRRFFGQRSVLVNSLAFFLFIVLGKRLLQVDRQYLTACLAFRDIAGDVYAYLQKHTGVINLINIEKQLTLLVASLASAQDSAVGKLLLDRYQYAKKKRAFWRRIKRVTNTLKILSVLSAALSFYRRWRDLPKRRQIGR